MRFHVFYRRQRSFDVMADSLEKNNVTFEDVDYNLVFVFISTSLILSSSLDYIWLRASDCLC